MGSLLVAVVALASLALSVSAFGGSKQKEAVPLKVAVTATDFKFALKPKTAKKGTVVFTVTNKGDVAHDFKIAGKKTKSLAAGKKQAITVKFAKAGRFAYICTLPGHAAAGMKGTLIVK
jgi:uncharacterized cupredoxin-like copper-binding protein